jgi:hypothetical protein
MSGSITEVPLPVNVVTPTCQTKSEDAQELSHPDASKILGDMRATG